VRTFDLILHHKTVCIFCPHCAHHYMNFTCILSTGNTQHVKTDTTCYIYILCVHVVLFVSSIFRLPKVEDGFPEEREDDEDIITDHTVFDCLSWKEVLSQIDDYYQVNLFLVKNNTLIFENYILSKSLYYYLTRFDIYRTSASGRRGRKAKTTEKQKSTTYTKTELIHIYVLIILRLQVERSHVPMVTCKCLICIHVMHLSKKSCIKGGVALAMTRRSTNLSCAYAVSKIL
jgi:hypothetical protein